MSKHAYAEQRLWHYIQFVMDNLRMQIYDRYRQQILCDLLLKVPVLQHHF